MVSAGSVLLMVLSQSVGRLGIKFCFLKILLPPFLFLEFKWLNFYLCSCLLPRCGVGKGLETCD